MASQVKQIRRRKQLKKQKSTKQRGFEVISEIANGAILSIKQQKELFQYYKIKGISITDNSSMASERIFFGFFNISGSIQFCKVSQEELDHMKQMMILSCKMLDKPIRITESDSFTIHQGAGDYLFSGKFIDIENVLRNKEREMGLIGFVLKNIN